jgi:2-keto-4-pentenoate hydratase/2-oxohepta-3-ene-1,7-dioic acid hydratase in catechol pathway
MRIIRYQLPGKSPQYGWVMAEKIGPIEGDVFGTFQRQEAKISFDSAALLPPVIPSKIICVGRNYAAHAREHGAEPPKVPLIFLKPPTSLIGHQGKIVLPPQSTQVEHEAELAIVIGKPGRWITPENALSHIFGYTIANDITARDLQRSDGQWTRAKGFDTFCPVGPWIETEFAPADAMITCHVNGEMRQMASTRDMIFSVQHLIAFASSVMTLTQGDLLLSGTPAGVSPLNTGDTVEVSVEGLGTLSNLVVSESSG